MPGSAPIPPSQNALDADTRDRLARRMGEKAFATRLATEAERENEARDPLGSSFTFVKHRFIRPVEIAILRLAGLYGRGLRNAREFTVRRFDIPLPGLPAAFDGFTILHASDLHIDMDPGLAPAVARFLADIPCDACALTGDFRNLTVGPWEEAVAASEIVLRALRRPVFAVLGNHDTLNIVPPLEASGARFLLNENQVIRRGAATLAFAGIDDPNIFGTHDLDRALSGLPPATFPVLLSHSPCIYREAAEKGVRLLLAGHTHGGQICLPGGHPIVGNDPSPRRFCHGVWRYGPLVGHTTAGIGSCGIPVRFHCPPEAAILTLRVPR